MSKTIQTKTTYKVEEKGVSFLSNGIKIAGVLYMPKDLYCYKGTLMKQYPFLRINHA